MDTTYGKKWVEKNRRFPSKRARRLKQRVRTRLIQLMQLQVQMVLLELGQPEWELASLRL
jgi:hypothetical protein